MRFLVLLNQRHIERDYYREGCALLRQHGDVETVYLSTFHHRPTDQDTEALAEFRSQLQTTDAAVIGPWYRPAMQPQHWQAAEQLQVFAGTFDNRFGGWVDFDAIASQNIRLIDTSRSMTPSVAEFTLAMTLNLIRDIPETMYLAREGRWKGLAWDKPGFVHGDLTGRRVGLAGFGSINRRYAELLAPFRCDVHVYDPFVSDEVFAQAGVARSDSLVELAQSSEIFVVGLPPTPTTQEIISRDVISALPRGALFVLVTRMAVVEQAPLWERLQAEEIAAAIDVFAPEPPPEDAWFRRHPNVQVTPHIAGGTDFCHRRCFTEACKDAIAVLAGEEPRFLATTRDHQIYEGKLTPAT